MKKSINFDEILVEYKPKNDHSDHFQKDDFLIFTLNFFEAKFLLGSFKNYRHL